MSSIVAVFSMKCISMNVKGKFDFGFHSENLKINRARLTLLR